MSSIHNIPEPTTGYRPVADEPVPVLPAIDPAARRADCAGTEDHSKPETELDSEVGGLTWLFTLIGCGLVVRAMLLYFGPLTAADANAAAWAGRGHALIEQGPEGLAGEMPLYPLLALGLDSTGLPMWLLAVLQCVVGIVAIPAGYVVGKRLTGSVLAGLGAAALMALHPGVLVWTTAASPVGVAGSVAVLGLYLLIRGDKERDASNAWPAGVAIGLAALLAPAVWLIGLGAAAWCVLKTKTAHRLSHAAIVLALSIAPVAAWSAWSGQAMVPRLTQDTSVSTSPHLASLTDQSLRELGRQMRFAVEPHGTLTRLTEDRAGLPVRHDRVADLAGDAWVTLNALIWLAAAVSLGLMLMRMRFAAAVLFALPLIGLLASGLTHGEPQRMALFGPLALLACAGVCTRAVPVLTAEQREQRAHEKELERQAKADARYTKREQKHGLYAFDKPQRTTPPAPEATIVPAGQALAGGEDPEPVMTRPI